MNKRRRREYSSGSSQGWMTTFADLMSLLLTFFILLYSMSNIDAKKFENISQSLQSVLSGIGLTSVFEGEDVANKIPLEEQINDNGDVTDQGILRMYSEVSEYISNEGLDAEVSVNFNRRGVFVDIKEAILFESGSAEIKDSGIEVLNKLHGLISSFDNEIVVEGHTDNVPINRPMYPSNWELSTARSVKVVRYLSEQLNIEPERLSAVGYGEYTPIVSNDTAENRAENRRVNILILIDEGGNDDG